MQGGNFYALRGKYKILRLLAEGGMGRVFLAEQLGASEFSKTVAVKVIRKKWTDMPLFRELFIGEAQLVADLIHENILQVYHLDEFDGSLGIVMEYIHGCTLDDINEQLDSVNSYIPPDLPPLSSAGARAWPMHTANWIETEDHWGLSIAMYLRPISWFHGLAL